MLALSLSVCLVWMICRVLISILPCLKMIVKSLIPYGVLKARQVSGSKNYIGLRENPEDAVERASRLYKGIEDIESQLVLLHVRFSDDGLAHSTRKCSGKDHGFAPVLHKRVYPYESYDWKAWHFVEDLPLSLTSLSGVTLISSDWQEDVFIFLQNSESL